MGPRQEAQDRCDLRGTRRRGKRRQIKRITHRLDPRLCRVVALGTPNERERAQWYFQRYVTHLPTGGEIVFFDRSWYNRAGVERVMGFCSDREYEEFLATVPYFENMIARSGIILIKYWLSILHIGAPCESDRAGESRLTATAQHVFGRTFKSKADRSDIACLMQVLIAARRS